MSETTTAQRDKLLDDLRLVIRDAEELLRMTAHQVGDETVELRSLMPAFLISELRRAFEIGFLLFMAFLVVDMVVAAVLMAMGMMMVPPVIVSLPFKLAFFVVADGWTLISGALVRSYF